VGTVHRCPHRWHLKSKESVDSLSITAYGLLHCMQTRPVDLGCTSAEVGAGGWTSILDSPQPSQT
jgi:hypothetical protein